MPLDTLLFFIFLFVLFLPGERLFPARSGQRVFRRGWWCDFLHTVVNPLLINAGAALLLGSMALGMRSLLPQGGRAMLSAQPFALQFVEIIVLSELAGYWAHRVSHRFSFLWRFHVVHHSAEELDWMVSHRQHPLEAIFLLGVANFPILVLGFPMSALGGFIVFQKLHTIFVHANLRVTLGPFRYLGALSGTGGRATRALRPLSCLSPS